MTRVPLTRIELDQALHALPGGITTEQGLGLKASCHPIAGFEVWYLDGVLVLRCARCQALVTVIEVADPPRIVS